MFGSQVLDIGIGIVMFFAFMSLMASALNEAIENLLKTRSMHLEQGIRNILDDHDGTKITGAFFNSPLISILCPGNYDASVLRKNKSGALPSAQSFFVPLSLRKNLPSYIPSANFALTILKMAAGTAEVTAKNIRANHLDTLKNCNQLQEIVIHALDIAGNDLVLAQRYIENWYDSAMDRVSGWYKRHTQIMLFFIGLSSAIILNADALTVTRSLMQDTVLRQAVVAQAQIVVGTAGLPGTRPDSFADTEDKLRKIGLPLGWNNMPQYYQAMKSQCTLSDCIQKSFTPEGFFGYFVFTIVGWFITAIAITVGAPFWFDLLAKFMQIRSALKPEASNVAQAAPATKTKKKADS